MTPIEIIVIVSSIVIVGTVFFSWLYRKIKGLPTGDCAMCSGNAKRLIKKYKKYCKQNNL